MFHICFEPCGFILRETVVYAVWYVLHATVWAIWWIEECRFETETGNTVVCGVKLMCLTVCFVCDVEEHNEMYQNKFVLNLLLHPNAQY
jgi:hypothetical protein